MRHVVLHSTVHAVDGFKGTPIEAVEVLGIAEDDNEAIDMIAAHARDNRGVVMGDRDDNASADQLWFLRGGGPKGEDITAGYSSPHDKRTYYRAVPTA